MYLYAPFMERRARRVTEEEHELSALMAERDRVINSLQELDFDFKLGKIPEEDYPAAAQPVCFKRVRIFCGRSMRSLHRQTSTHRIQKRAWNVPLPPAARMHPLQRSRSPMTISNR